MRRTRLLSVLAVGYVVLDLLHFGDHLRQGRALAPQIYTAGTVGLVVAIAVAVLAVRHHALAAPAATAFGLVAAVGVTASHLLPAWGYLSDSYIPLHLDALSWISAIALVAGALALAACGASLLIHPDQARADATT